MTPTAVRQPLVSRVLPAALPAILVCYLILGGLFAVLVPPWQAPDEPAHYNYVRQLARTGAYPVIALGDYNQDLIGNQVAPPTARPSISLDALQYEDHQPPLFYTLAAPVFLLFNGALVPLRLFALLVGALGIVFAYLTVREIFPQQPYLAAFAATFVAFLPQHLAMSASFNNDALSEALIALTLWLSVRHIQQSANANASARLPVLLGVVVGLAFLTKVQAYLALPVAVFAVWAGWRVSDQRQSLLRGWLLVIIIAGIIGLPWWIHGLQVYGGTDVLGLQRHNLVVAGQSTTAEWIAQYGWGGLLSRMAQFTFQSFWGQFGWMSVVLDRRFYILFLGITVISTVLFMTWWLHGLSAWNRLKARIAAATPEQPAVTSSGASVYAPFLVLTRAQSLALDMLALLALGALLGFIWYNLQFVQHQGRYLYSGLIPIGTALALGWHFIMSRRARILPWLWALLLLAFLALDAHLLFRVILPTMRG